MSNPARLAIRRVPPRWAVGDACVATQRTLLAKVEATGSPATAMGLGCAVRGSTFAIEPPYRFATQSDPFPYVIPVGPSPTGIVVAIAIVCGSISESVPSRLFVTHTAAAVDRDALGSVSHPDGAWSSHLPASTCVRKPSLIDVTHAPLASAAIAVGPSPTGTAVPTTVEVEGSMRVTESSLKFATHTASSEAATALGPFPTPMRLTTLSVVGSTRSTSPASLATTQTLPAPNAKPLAPPPIGDRVDHGVRVGVDLQEGPGLGVREPDDPAPDAIPPGDPWIDKVAAIA